MTTKNLVTFSLNIILASIISGYLIYRRLLVIRLPKELYIYDGQHLKMNLVFFIIVSTGFFIINLGHVIILLRKKKPSENVFTQIAFNINIILEKAFADFYNFIASFIPDVYDKISYFTQKFYVIFYKRSEALFIIILYGIRFIILCCFLLDVFLFFKLYYMYKALYLLGISMGIKLCFYILKDFSSNLEKTESFLIITEMGYDDKTNLPKTKYKLKPPYKDYDLDYHIGQYILCSKISGYLEIYQRYTNFFYPYVVGVLSFSYLIGWSYVIIINLSLIL